MFQVLVKTTPHMTGSYAYVLPDKAAAQAFVQRSDVWRYLFPVEDDDLDWHRGGAWTAHEAITPVEMTERDLAEMTYPGQVTCDEVSTAGRREEGGEGDDRW